MDSPEHRALAREAARNSLVLLKNQNQLLPLAAPLKVALIGPNANVTDTLCSNYYGSLPHVVSVLEGLQAVPGLQLSYAKGCDINSQDRSGFAAAVSAATAAQVAVVVLGIDEVSYCTAAQVFSLYLFYACAARVAVRTVDRV